VRLVVDGFGWWLVIGGWCGNGTKRISDDIEIR
jgi:hypothetical protein